MLSRCLPHHHEFVLPSIRLCFAVLFFCIFSFFFFFFHPTFCSHLQCTQRARSLIIYVLNARAYAFGARALAPQHIRFDREEANEGTSA